LRLGLDVGLSFKTFENFDQNYVYNVPGNDIGINLIYTRMGYYGENKDITAGLFATISNIFNQETNVFIIGAGYELRYYYILGQIEFGYSSMSKNLPITASGTLKDVSSPYTSLNGGVEFPIYNKLQIFSIVKYYWWSYSANWSRIDIISGLSYTF